MRKLLALLIVIAAFPACSRFASTRVFLHGEIEDEEGRVVPFAVVRVGPFETLSDGEGHYRVLYMADCLRGTVGIQGVQTPELEVFAKDYAPYKLGFHLDTMEEAHSHKGLDAFNRPRLGGIGEMLAPMIEERTGIESRATVLGHMQRGGVPSAYDRVLATRLGMAAVDAAYEGRWGSMVSLRGTDVVNVSIADATGGLKTVPPARYEEAALLFG